MDRDLALVDGLVVVAAGCALGWLAYRLLVWPTATLERIMKVLRGDRFPAWLRPDPGEEILRGYALLLGIIAAVVLGVGCLALGRLVIR